MSNATALISSAKMARASAFVRAGIGKHAIAAKGDWFATAERVWASRDRDARLWNAIALLSAATPRDIHTVTFPGQTFSATKITADEGVIAEATALAMSQSRPGEANSWRGLVWEWSKAQPMLREALVRTFLFDVCGGASI